MSEDDYIMIVLSFVIIVMATILCIEDFMPWYFLIPIILYVILAFVSTEICLILLIVFTFFLLGMLYYLTLNGKVENIEYNIAVVYIYVLMVFYNLYVYDVVNN